jgi:hypothetical protein
MKHRSAWIIFYEIPILADFAARCIGRPGKCKKAADRAASRMPDLASDLFQLRRDAGEGGVELAAEAVHGGDDRNRNAGGDQTIFNRRGARLVLPEPSEKSIHDGQLPVLGRAEGGTSSFLWLRKTTDRKCNYDNLPGKLAQMLCKPVKGEKRRTSFEMMVSNTNLGRRRSAA